MMSDTFGDTRAVHLGRSLQQDPAGMVDGPNLYAYCGNEPVNRVDPGGERYLRIIIGGRGITRSLLSVDDMVACMVEKYPHISPGAMAILVAICLKGAPTLVGLVLCAAASYPGNIAADFIDCAYQNWGKTSFYWYFFYVFLTPTGYSGFYPI